MRHEPFEPMEYRHQELMDDLNEFMIRVKMHVFDLKIKRPPLQNEEIDEIFHRLRDVLMQDKKPMRLR